MSLTLINWCIFVLIIFTQREFVVTVLLFYYIYSCGGTVQGFFSFFLLHYEKLFFIYPVPKCIALQK